MEIQVESAANAPCRVTLAGEMNIYAAAELKDKLISPLDAHDELEIDLSRVAEMDSSGLQVLILAKRHAAAHNKSLRLVGHSRPVRELLELYNLAVWFGDPLVIPADEAGATYTGERP